MTLPSFSVNYTYMGGEIRCVKMQRSYLKNTSVINWASPLCNVHLRHGPKPIEVNGNSPMDFKGLCTMLLLSGTPSE